MVMVHPGQQVALGRGPRLLLAVSQDHASTVELVLDPAGSFSLTRHRHGHWVLAGSPGASARIAVVAGDRRAMSDLLTVTLSLPGASPAVSQRWELGDIQVDFRDRVTLLSVDLDADESWSIRSLVAATAPESVRPLPARAQVMTGEPVSLGLGVAVDRSASMQWAIAGGALSDILDGLMWARRRALTPDSSVSWCSYGSGDRGGGSDADGVREIHVQDRSPEEVAHALGEVLPSSGARLDIVARRLSDRQVLVAVTDTWPEPEVLRLCQEVGLRLGLVLVGIPPDADGWPVDWQEQDARCASAGVSRLAVGDGRAARNAVREWCMLLLGQPVEPVAVEALP